MYLQTEDITPFGSGISWCFELGKQGLTPWRTSLATCKIEFKEISSPSGETRKTKRRTSLQRSSSLRKAFFKNHMGLKDDGIEIMHERVQMSGETFSSETVSPKHRPTQVYLHVLKG